MRLTRFTCLLCCIYSILLSCEEQDVVFRIGSTGPAGGVVFYDKGDLSYGWRYLEAAPADHAGRTIWQNTETYIEGTSADIGTGASNTQRIVEVLGEGDYAAKFCADLVVGEYDDWFLPSRDELLELCLNKDVVFGFEYTYYWSSTEYNPDYAWAQCFHPEYENRSEKAYEHRVRAIRAF